MIGFLGGTGPEGRSLALRLALAGEKIAIGSRDAARAREMVQKVEARGQSIRVTGGENTEIVGMSDVIFITVPYEGQAALLESLAPSLAGKLVVDTVAPVSFQDGKIERVAYFLVIFLKLASCQIWPFGNFRGLEKSRAIDPERIQEEVWSVQIALLQAADLGDILID